MLLAEVVDASRSVAATSARSAKVTLIAQLLSAADVGEVEIAVSYLSGELRQRRTGVGWAALRDLPPAAATPQLTLADVDAAFGRIADAAGSGSQSRRAAELRQLFGAATAAEQQFLRALAMG